MIRTLRPIRVDGDIAYVPLTQGYFAVIDASDVPLILGHNWHVNRDSRTCYGKTNIRRQDGGRATLMLHQAITGFALTDHIDGDGLNNRRSNLRKATIAENNRNRRQRKGRNHVCKGAHWSTEKGKWRARIRVDGKRIHLGYYATPDLPHAAYVDASSRYHGEFGRTS